MKKFFVIGVMLVTGLFALSACGSSPEGIWFDDIDDSVELSDDEKMAFANYIVGEGELPNDGKARIVFLSFSDGDERAEVVFGTGNGYLEAVDEALAKVENPDVEWIKVDVVSEVEVVKNPDFDLPMEFDRSLYGMAFPEVTQTVFLPEELTANTILNSDYEVRFGNIEDYFDEEGVTISTSLLRDSEELYYFSTESFFFEKNTLEIQDLYRGHPMYDELTAEFLLEAATAGGKYLAAAVREDGSFVYDYLPKTDKENDGYNILRHAGTLYSMMELYQVTEDAELLEAAERALEYMLDAIKLCYSAPYGELCLIEDDVVKLGGNGLALVALTEYMQATGSRAYLAKAQGLALWIASTQDENDHLSIHKMNNVTNEIDGFESYYYPGEAILGLVRLYAVDGNSRWLDIAEGEAKYIIEVRDADVTIDTVEHDHWFLYGLNELYRDRPEDMYLEHAELIVDAIVKMQRNDEDEDYGDWEGSYYDPPRSTPTATRNEGLMAAYNLFTYVGDDEKAAEALATTELGVKFALQTQFGPELAMYVEDPQRVLGGFHENLTDYSIRIDYVQHNISALLALREVMLGLQSQDL